MSSLNREKLKLESRSWQWRSSWCAACFVLVTTLSSCATTGGIYHVVGPGENLYRIGKAYGVSYEHLAHRNHMQPPYQLEIGDELFIPGADRQLPVSIITPSAVSEEPPPGEPHSAVPGAYAPGTLTPRTPAPDTRASSTPAPGALAPRTRVAGTPASGTQSLTAGATRTPAASTGATRAMPSMAAARRSPAQSTSRGVAPARGGTTSVGLRPATPVGTRPAPVAVRSGAIASAGARPPASTGTSAGGRTQAASVRATANAHVARASAPAPVVELRRDTRVGPTGFSWPLSGRVSSIFGKRTRGHHDGIDIAAPKGSAVYASRDGKVIFSDRLSGYGNVIIVEHASGYASVYAHNDVNYARKGARVKRGERIAAVGDTGRTRGAHLHFEVRRYNVARNPLYYLPSGPPASLAAAR